MNTTRTGHGGPTRKRLTALLLTLCMILGLVPGGIVTASAADAVPYYYYTVDGDTATLHTDSSCEDYTLVTAGMSDTATIDDETYLLFGADDETTWYVVKDDVTISSYRIATCGTVNLILCDGATLTPTQGIMVSSGELNIYGQSEGTGKISSANVSESYVISVNGGQTLRLHGGQITGNASGRDIVYAADNCTVDMYGGSIHDNTGTGVAIGDSSSTFNLYGGAIYGNTPVDVALYNNSAITLHCEPDENWNGGHGLIKVNAFDDSAPTDGVIVMDWPEDVDPAVYFESGNSAYGVTSMDYSGTNVAALATLYTVTFDKGEGNGEMASVEVPAGPYVFPECGFIPPEGQVFSKWSIDDEDYYHAGEEGYIYQSVTATALYAVPIPYQYYTPDGAAHEGSATDYTILTDDMEAWDGGGDAQSAMWYVAQEEVNISERVQVGEYVNLILCDGATLNIPKGIQVEYGNHLTIYAQSDGDMGMLTIDDVDVDNAGIGGDGYSGGTIAIHGGKLNVNGGDYGAGIGGGRNGAGGTIAIYGGEVEAQGGENGAGIGGGSNGAGGTITVSGGDKIEATGGDYAAGIGGGATGAGGTITVSGGTVTATGKMRPLALAAAVVPLWASATARAVRLPSAAET